MRRHIIIPILALALVTAPAAAQRPDTDQTRVTTTAFLTVGMNLLDVDALNSVLSAQGYAGMSDRFFSLGGGAHLVLNQAVLGLDGSMLLAEQASSTNGTFRAELGGSSLMARFGYLVYEGDNLDIYPLIGVGYGRMTLDIVDVSARTFDEVLADPRVGADLDKGGFLIGAALGTDYVFEAGRGSRRGPVLGLRVGYDYSPVESDWEIDGSPLLSGPELSLSGPYLRLMLGFGGRGPRCCGGR